MCTQYVYIIIIVYCNITICNDALYTIYREGAFSIQCPTILPYKTVIQELPDATIEKTFRTKSLLIVVQKIPALIAVKAGRDKFYEHTLCIRFKIH